MARRFLPLIATVAIVVALANFLWFLADVTRAGGGPDHLTAPPPYMVNDHGRFTQVDRQTWEWLNFHEQTLLLTHPLALAGAAYLTLRLARFAQDGNALG